MLMSIVARVGQVCLILSSAASLFSELNVLLASTRRTASVSLPRKVSLITCMAASIPAIWPAQSCKDPVASCRSHLVTVGMALEIILQAVSHTPMGLTPGYLSRAISLHASRAERPRGLTKCYGYSDHMRFYSCHPYIEHLLTL